MADKATSKSTPKIGPPKWPRIEDHPEKIRPPVWLSFEDAFQLRNCFGSNQVDAQNALNALYGVLCDDAPSVELRRDFDPSTGRFNGKVTSHPRSAEFWHDSVNYPCIVPDANGVYHIGDYPDRSAYDEHVGFFVLAAAVERNENEESAGQAVSDYNPIELFEKEISGQSRRLHSMSATSSTTELLSDTGDANENKPIPPVETSPATETDAKLEEPDENKLTRGQRQVNNALKHLEQEKGRALYDLRKEDRKKLVEQQIGNKATISLALLGQVEAVRPLKRRIRDARKSKSRSDP
jgi:hypothetical protein